jgi:hypothetical protein
MNRLPTLEQRIAAALTPTDITSTDLGALIAEVEAAAAAADENATRAREEALDPAVVVDTAKVGAAVATATLTRDRLQAALPRLQERLKLVREQEDLAAWKADAEKLEVRRIAKMTEFADFYPPMYERIVDHLYSMRALDREIDDLNRRRPNGKLRALDYSTPAFTVDLKIPDPYNKDQPLWPPLQLTPSQQLARAMLANPDAYTDRFVVSEAAAGTYIEARNRRVLEDNRRQIAEAEQRQREREQGEAAEMAKIKEADHMGRAAD